MKPIRVGVIGCGVIGPTHAESFRRIDGVELRWACDLVEERARNLADKYGASRTTTSYGEVLADPDVDCVSVCTDHASHVSIVVDALRAGKHVLCEKALVANRQGLNDMFAAHRAAPGVIFAAVSQHRFEAVNRCMRRYVEEGRFGRILTASVQLHCFRSNAYYETDAWRGTWAEEGGSVLINQAIHFIDILTWVMGGVSEVCGAHTNLTHHGVIETEDTAVCAVRFKNGALGCIEATSSSNLKWEQTLSVCGSEGSVELRNGKPLRIAFSDPAVDELVTAELQRCHDSPGAQVAKDYYGAGHVGQVADFVAAIREDRDPFVSAADVHQTVKVVLGVYESQKTGGWVATD